MAGPPSPSALSTEFGLEFRRIGRLPPYVFAVIDQLKLELRRAGEDVIDLGFGNPDIPSPPEAVEKLCEAAQKPRNHRYSASRGIPKLRQAVCELYERKFGVELDPETQAITTIGAKEGLSHLMWVLLQPGDSAVVPSPSYPIHIYAPVLRRRGGRAGPHGRPRPEDLFGNIVETFERSWPRPRVIILSFPAQPDDGDRRSRVHAAGRRLRARERGARSSTTSPTRTSASTATRRRRSSRPRARTRSPSSSTR